MVLQEEDLMIVYQCQDSLESIFTAVYNAYEEHRDHNDTRISLDEEYYLFAEYIPVKTDIEKAAKVIRTLKKRFGEEDYLSICHALSSPDGDKAHVVYQTIVKGLKGNVRPGHLLDNLADNDCSRTFSLARSAGREMSHLYGFLRFQEVQGGILYARIGPKNNLMTFLMPHFADRFPMENFVMYDDNRGIFGIHPAGKEWYLAYGMETDLAGEMLNISEGESRVQELFCHFCRTIAIKERENKKLQQNMLPLRFQEYMPEFNRIKQVPRFKGMEP